MRASARPLRLGSGTREECGAHALEEIVVLAFDAVRVEITATGPGPAFAHIDIEQQGQAGLQADDAAFQFGDQSEVKPTPGALVGVAGIGEAVAHHPGAARERGQHRFGDVLRARGEHQQQFGFGRRRLVRRIEQQGADLLRQRRTAGFARAHDFAAAGFEFGAQRLEDGGLARAFATFEAEEARVLRHCLAGRHAAHGVAALRCAR